MKRKGNGNGRMKHAFPFSLHHTTLQHPSSLGVTIIGLGVTPSSQKGKSNREKEKKGKETRAFFPFHLCFFCGVVKRKGERVLHSSITVPLSLHSHHTFPTVWELPSVVLSVHP